MLLAAALLAATLLFLLCRSGVAGVRSGIAWAWSGLRDGRRPNDGRRQKSGPARAGVGSAVPAVRLSALPLDTTSIANRDKSSSDKSSSDKSSSDKSNSDSSCDKSSSTQDRDDGRRMPPPRLPGPQSRPRPAGPEHTRSARLAPPMLAPPARPSLGGSVTATATATATTTNPARRRPVRLEPGHSPLDWAALQRSGADLAGVSRLHRLTPADLRRQNGRHGRPAWSAYHGKVYNLAPFLPFHPGGAPELMRAAGRDGAALFHDVHPWVSWENMLDGCLVGIMVNDHVTPNGHEPESRLDDLD